MKRLGSLAALLLAITAMAVAAPVACPTTTTLDQLIALSGTGAGCIIQDKIFNDFTYTNGRPASEVGVTLVFESSGSLDVHGWVFAPTTGVWTSGFSLGYNITVAPGFPNVAIIASKDQVNSGLTPNGVVVSDLQTTAGGAFNTITTRGLAGQETAQVIWPTSTTSISTSSSVTIGSGSFVQSYEQNWFQTTTANVPEPSSLAYALLGGGFVLIGLLRFRKV